MSKEPLTITGDPASELARALAEQRGHVGHGQAKSSFGTPRNRPRIWRINGRFECQRVSSVRRSLADRARGKREP